MASVFHYVPEIEEKNKKIKAVTFIGKLYSLKATISWWAIPRVISLSITIFFRKLHLKVERIKKEKSRL